MQSQHKNKKCDEVDAWSSVGELDHTELEEFQPAKKMLRSSCSETTRSAAKSRNPYVLPHLFIICKRAKSYFTESVSLF